MRTRLGEARERQAREREQARQQASREKEALAQLPLPLELMSLVTLLLQPSDAKQARLACRGMCRAVDARVTRLTLDLEGYYMSTPPPGTASTEGKRAAALVARLPRLRQLQVQSGFARCLDSLAGELAALRRAGWVRRTRLELLSLSTYADRADETGLVQLLLESGRECWHLGRVAAGAVIVAGSCVGAGRCGGHTSQAAACGAAASHRCKPRLIELA